MSGPAAVANPLGFEAFGTSCGLALVAGALAAVAPALSMLTAALTALAIAGWASLRHRSGRGRPVAARSAATYVLPLAVLAAGAVLFVDPVSPLGAWKALLLGLTLVPLWVVERRRVRPASGSGTVGS